MATRVGLFKIPVKTLNSMTLKTRDVPDFTYPNPSGAGSGRICELKSGQSRNWIWEFSSTQSNTRVRV